jgi:transposase-like protein
MSMEADVERVIGNLTRIKENLSDARSFETHEHELLEIDGTLSALESRKRGEEDNVIQARVTKARALYKDVTGLIESLIATSDWCNCEWYDDMEVNPVLVARVNDYLDNNDYDATRCESDKWERPERSNDQDLPRVRWNLWRNFFISACIDPSFKPQRKGAVRGSPRTPFTDEELPGKSFTAIQVFERVKKFVFYNRRNGALYYRSLAEDGETVNVRRILCQEDERRAVFSKYWNDPGICSHRGRATSHARFLVNFLGISRLDVELFIKETELYQISSKHKVIPKVVQPLVTSRPMEHLQADLVDMGVFQNYGNVFRYILVMVDLFSKFLWARPLKTKDAPEVRSAIMGVLWNEGFPTIFQTDNGGEFALIGEELRDRGIIVRRGRAYKPSSQGQVERTNRTLKQAFYMDFLASENYEWETGMPEKVYAYNTMVHSAIRKTPYEIHRGVRPRNAPEFTDNHAAELLTTYIGGPARTILSDATSEAPADLARFILEDERILMSSWAASNRTLLPSIEVVSTMVATQKEEDGYETPDEPVESDDILSARKTPILSPKRPLDSETPTRVLRPRKNSKP